MAFKLLQDVLGHLEKQDTWQTRRRFQRIQTSWRQTVGAAVAAQTRPLSMRGSTLYVATSSAAWAQNLTFERRRILAKLNAQLPPAAHLKDIRFSTAQWQVRSLLEQSQDSEWAAIWREHPSRIGDSALGSAELSPTDSPDPNLAFQKWSQVVQAQTRHLALCPECQCPTPDGELKRWSRCALCAAKQWQ